VKGNSAVGSADRGARWRCFVEFGRIVLDEKPIPDVDPLDALIRITTTTICGTDVHILKGRVSG
jgi:threonine dehydrogenase-like Zn-dependent dehydrogenase